MGPNQGWLSAIVHQFYVGNNLGLSKGQATVAWFNSNKGLCQIKLNESYHSLAFLRFKEGPLNYDRF